MTTPTAKSADASAPSLPDELIEDLLGYLFAHILNHLDASAHNLPAFLTPNLAHTLLCTLPNLPPRLTNLVFIRLKNCQPTTFAANGDTSLIRRMAHERQLARAKFRHWHQSPWSLLRDPTEIEWVQSIAAGASRGNKVHVLEWLTRQPETSPDVWKRVCASTVVVNVSSNPVVLASAYGSLAALEWWRLALRVDGWMSTERARKLAIECMALAAARGHMEAVAWWARQFGGELGQASGAKESTEWVWEQVEAHVKRLGMDSESFKRVASAMVSRRRSTLRVGASA